MVLKAIEDTAKRLRSAHVESAGDILTNRFVSAASQIGMGGSIAAIATYYMHPPEQLHAHVVALVIFAWNSLVFLVTFAWRRKFKEDL